MAQALRARGFSGFLLSEQSRQVRGCTFSPKSSCGTLIIAERTREGGKNRTLAHHWQALTTEAAHLMNAAEHRRGHRATTVWLGDSQILVRQSEVAYHH